MSENLSVYSGVGNKRDRGNYQLKLITEYRKNQHLKPRRRYSGPIGLYLREIYNQYENITKEGIIKLLGVVRRGTFPRNPLVIKKASFIDVERVDDDYIRIKAPISYLLRLENLLGKPAYNSLIKKYSLSKKRASIRLIPGATIDFEVTNLVGGMPKNPDIARKKRLYLRLRSPEAGKAREKIVDGSLPFVVKVATEYNLPYYLEDLVSDGNIGLLRAIDHFNPKRQASFFTCAGYWINQSIRTFLQENAKSKSGLFRIHQHAYAKMEFIEEIERIAVTEKGIIPSDEELYQEIEKLRKQGITAGANLKITRKNVAFFRKLSSVESFSLSQLDAESCSNLLRSDDKEQVDKLIEDETALDLLERLNSRNIAILKRKYFEDKTRREIAEEQELSCERVRQLINKSLEQLREIEG